MTADPDTAADAAMADAVAAHRAGDVNRAEGLYRAFLDTYGARPEVLNNLAGLRYQAGDWADAAALYSATLDAGAQHPAVFANLARAHQRLGAVADAVRAFEHALVLAPGDAAVWNDLGNARFAAGDAPAAAEAYESAVQADPNFVRAHNNLGNTRRALGAFDQALSAYETACELVADDHPDAGEVHTNRAHALLLAGRWDEGFEAYAWRWKKPGVPAPVDPGSPLWGGGPLDGRRILIVAEQGFGDCILGLRFAQVLADRAAWVGFAGPVPLVRLAAATAGIDGAIAFGDPAPDHDLHVPVMDLPGRLGARPDTMPGQVPYIGAMGPPARPPGPLRAGLAWAGNPAHIDDAHRSLAFRALAPVLDVAGVDFVSLQVGPDAADAEGDARVRNGVSTVTDFFDTAHVIAGLDVVIAADSAVAHLAGAMGAPVWVPLPRVPDWRYGLRGETPPFFPTMRVYRQSVRGDWSEPLARIAADLAGLRDESKGAP